jgi:lipopolysaccharide/colanic/teichoic acid biosynthesis glycosyltransferase
MTPLTDAKTTPPPGALAEPRPLARSGVREIAGGPVPRLDGASPRGAGPTTDWDALAGNGWYRRFGRRGLDLTLLLVFGPLALIVGTLVALANLAVFRRPSLVFFVQPRVGHRGRRFPIVKFRTMREVAEAGDEYGSWGSGGDRLRVTRFGRFLRNTHLDELPQLLNVLVGHMAVVGPRPEMVEIEEWASRHVEGFTTRLAVPPGITGYAQVTQGYTGNDVDAYREKFRVADWYRRKQSLRLDLEILARTAVWMVRGRGWQWNLRTGSVPELAEAGDD